MKIKNALSLPLLAISLLLMFSAEYVGGSWFAFFLRISGWMLFCAFGALGILKLEEARKILKGKKEIELPENSD